jgi:PhoD-like phosphatase
MSDMAVQRRSGEARFRCEDERVPSVTVPPGNGRRADPTRIRRCGRAWAVVAAAAVLGSSYTRWLPQAADPGPIPRGIAVPLQAGLLGLGLLGVLVGWRWEATGLAVLAVAGAGLGFLASVQYPLTVAAPVAGAIAVPAALLWIAYRRTRQRGALVVLTVVMSVLAVGVWLGADRLYDHYTGPSHPQSSLRAVPPDRVLWSWAGALTPNSFTVTARLAHAGRARLAVSVDHGPAQPRYSDVQTAGPDTGNAVRLTVTGLIPATRYRYGLDVDGHPDRLARGSVSTPPVGPASFRFAFGSDARAGSNGSVFDAIRALDPLFFLQIGDLFYGDVDTADLPRFRRLYDLTLTAPAQAALYRSTATAYLWDDHDFGTNETDREAASKPAASRAYREAVPHYPLRPAADGPIYQAFTVGRVRFLLTDTRSARSPRNAPDDDQKSALGPTQRAWLEAELLAGRDRYALMVWVSPIPWIEAPKAGIDGWGGFTTERRQLADLIATAGIRNLLVIGGDAHMLAIDDGSHSDYSGLGGAGFPVFHAAPLDRLGEIKGGPYTLGPRTEGGQFGLVTVQDPGRGPVTITLSGRTYTGAEVMRYRFTSPRPATPAG